MKSGKTELEILAAGDPPCFQLLVMDICYQGRVIYGNYDPSSETLFGSVLYFRPRYTLIYVRQNTFGYGIDLTPEEGSGKII